MESINLFTICVNCKNNFLKPENAVPIAASNATSGDIVDREKSEEISVAQNPETVAGIENGDIASEERKHYNQMLHHVQNQGMECKKKVNH